jgi:HlyD family secretion protein
VKKLLLVLVVVGGSLAGLFYWLNAHGQTPVEKQIFTFATISKGPMVESVSATGAVEPKDMVLIHSETPGTVVEVLADVNASVTEGTVLVKLDGGLAKLKVEQAKIGVQTTQAAVEQARASVTTAEAGVDQAEAARFAAEKALKYQQDMDKSGFRKDLEKAEIDLEAAKAGVKAAQAKLKEAQASVEIFQAKSKDAENQLQQAQLALQKTELKVPVLPSSLATGVATKKHDFLILKRNIKVGQLVGPTAQAPLFVLAGGLQQMEVHTEVVEGDIGRVRPGQTALFTINSYDDPDFKFQGTVREVQPLPTNVKGAVYYNAVIEVANQKDPTSNAWRLLPGMTTAVDIIVQQRKSAWKVPLAALNFQMEAAYLSAAARERLAEWQSRPDAADWKPVWVWQADVERVWPVFVRLSHSAKGLKGLQDGEFHEILEWEPGQEPATTGTGLPVIINAPPAQQPGFLDRSANLKLS